MNEIDKMLYDSYICRKSSDYLSLLENNKKIYYKMIELYGESDEKTIAFLSYMSDDYRLVANHNDALKTDKIFYKKSCQLFGKNSELALSALNSLSLDYMFLKQYDLSYLIFKTCLKNVIDVYGINNENTIICMQNLAKNCIHLKRFEESLKLNITCYRALKKFYGKRAKETIDCIEEIAKTYRLLNNYEEALKWQKRSFRLLMKKNGMINENTIRCMIFVADDLEILKREQEALKYNKNIYYAFIKLYGDTDTDIVTAMERIADNYVRLNKTKQAMEYYDRCYDYFKDLLNMDLNSSFNNINFFDDNRYRNKYFLKYIISTNKETELSFLHKLARICYKSGKFREWFEYEDRCYKESKEIFNKKDDETLTSLYYLAKEYRQNGKDDIALKIAKTCYESKVEISGENDLYTLELLYFLAEEYSSLEKYETALKLHAECYKKRQTILGSKNENTLKSMNKLAALLHLTGHLDFAIRMLEKCYQYQLVTLSEKNDDTLTSMMDLGILYFTKGEYSKGYDLCQHCYDIRVKTSDSHSIYTIDNLLTLASFDRVLGDFHKSLNSLNICYKSYRQLLGDTHSQTLNVLMLITLTYVDMGNHETAYHYALHALNLCKKEYGMDHLTTIKSLLSVSNILLSMKRYDSANKNIKIVYEYYLKEYGENHVNTINSMLLLTLSYLSLNDFHNAKLLNEHYSKLPRNMYHILDLIYQLLSVYIYYYDEDYSLFNSKMIYIFELIKKDIYNMIELIEKTDFRYFLKIFNNTQPLFIKYYFMKTNDINDYIYLLNFKTIIQDIDYLKQNLHKLPEYNNKKDYLNILENKSSTNLKKITSVRNEIKTIVTSNLGALNLNIDLKQIQDHLNKSDILIDLYEIDKNTYGIVFIEKDCFYSRYIVSEGKHNKEIFDYIAQFIKNKEHLYICPDGELYNISFERYIDDIDISYLSSPKSLLRKNDQKSDDDHIVSFVYPDFNDNMNDDENYHRGNKVNVLYGSYLEGLFIKEIYHERCTLYTRKEANHDNFLKVTNPKILHVSTHGQYDKSIDLLMNRGKLLLAGYNVENESDKLGTGYVTATEIQNMNLHSTDLVVLSACNTGSGKTLPGEGIYGIRRAFELAGAKTLLLTVEQVDDYNTAIFMKVFYRFYNESNNVYNSFRATRRYLSQFENAIIEFEELKNTFEISVKKISKNERIYKKHLKRLIKIINESKDRGYIVVQKGIEYIKEDWKGFVIHGRIDI